MKDEIKKDLPREGAHTFLFSDEVKPHAEALGGLVIMFSGLELQLSILINVMLDIEFTPKGDALGDMEMKTKLRLIKPLGLVAGKDKPNEWYERLLDLLVKIEGLCGERNRMIHDVWGLTDKPGELVRIRLKPQIAKQPLELKMAQCSVSVLDITNLTCRVFEAIRELVALAIELKPSLMLKSP